MKTLQVFLLS